MSAPSLNPPPSGEKFSRPTPPKPAASAARHAPQRDFVTTINDDGSRYFLHPADVRGWFSRWRRFTGLFLVAVYLLLPWIPAGGYPAVFLDLAERRFHFFGYTLAAQDTWLLFFGLTGMGFGLFFLTALLGRVWCGYACPQTVFLDHIYRRIERMIDGDAPARRQLDAAPLDAVKTAKRVLKHALYIVTSLVITHLFLAYFVSIPEVWHMMSAAPAEHWAAFLFVFIAAGALYFNFAWFREQLCIVICPYGRMQSALSDDHTMTIGYDSQRGEPRGKVGTVNAGACIDCNRCVQVCPTGIDIRHGMQLECIGCAACIDACDEIMTKVKRPTGLIRYDSLVGLNGGKTRWMRPRTILYGVLLLIGIAVASFAFSTVKPVTFMVTRMSGAAYFVGRDDVRNQFLVRLLNKRNVPTNFIVTLQDLPAHVQQNGFSAPVAVGPMAEQVGPLVLVVDRKFYTGPFKATLVIQDETKAFTLSRPIEFLGPDAQLLQQEDAARGIKR
ncbi:MAG: cytochrome c oxidase accessory protein CcoG [Opitutus sp.]|nr:cytochrome c oxidase accessory protein CcoG [Opitutus sp.]